MKIQQSSHISAFGGINFVYDDFDALGLGQLFEKNLPSLSKNSTYNWKDISSGLGSHLKDNPYCKIASPDILLRRMGVLAQCDRYCNSKRGAMEKQFDILKNDFGWNHMPFSSLAKNTVFLILMAMCRNIYHTIIQRLSQKFKGIIPTFRLKRFIFKIIILPAQWIYRSRQKVLKIYGEIAFKT